MILHTPKVTHEGERICIAARFELRNKLAYLPDHLWYRVPEVYEKCISVRVDTFAPTALLMAMYSGEPLSIRGPISPKLAYGLLEYRNIFHSWSPKLFHMIDVNFDSFEPVASYDGQTAVATAFSGGVDSFHTLWSHLVQNQEIPDARVTHGLFIHGLDLRLNDEINYLKAAEIYTDLFQHLDLELIRMSTNAYHFSEFRIPWTLFDGPPLIGAALLLSPFLRRFYTPSGMPSYNDLIPQATSPLIDHLLSTENFDVIHHGASANRIQKIKVVSNWPMSHHRLRVCSDKLRMDGVKNCSACHKCYRTIAVLSLLKALPNHRNFNGDLRVSSYVRWGLFTLLDPDQVRHIRNEAWSSNQFGMVVLLQIAILLREVKRTTIHIIKSLMSRELVYRIKRKIYSPENTETEEMQ